MINEDGTARFASVEAAGPGSGAPMRFWKADSHQWGKGKTHVLAGDGARTRCGKQLALCPGHATGMAECDCQGCLNAIERDKQRVIDEARRNQSQLEWQQKRDAASREWWRKYNAYLQSPEWQRRRALVLRRARGVCEACGERPAAEVHHLTYRHVFHEPLFDLAAVCTPCHDDLTRRDREERTARFEA